MSMQIEGPKPILIETSRKDLAKTLNDPKLQKQLEEKGVHIEAHSLSEDRVLIRVDNDQNKPSEWGIAATVSHFDKGCEHGNLIGLRAEREFDIWNSGNFGVAAVGSQDVRMNSTSFHVAPGVGLKAQYGSEALAGYATGGVSLNIGTLGGHLTAGAGARVAAGVEAKVFYAEVFAEKATNYDAHGLAAGARLRW
ncbi:MAG: hypothetical protein ACAI44_20930 [Candidatus Sericytochromatia bacterium]